MNVHSNWWDCEACQVSLLTSPFDNKVIMKIYDGVELGQRRYRIMMDLNDPPMISISDAKVNQVILTTSYPIDHITPSNIKEKLKTYLVFL